MSQLSHPNFAFLQSEGLISLDDEIFATPLSGGVSSEIWHVRGSERPYCVKQAKAKLDVAADWFAPVERNAAEAAWLRAVAGISRDAVPQVIAEDQTSNTLVMSFLDPADYPVWKAQLASGHVNPATAFQVGATLGTIHAGTADSPSLAAEFANDDMFISLRLSPYFEESGRRNSDVATILHYLCQQTLATKRVLLHGDVSPKNILVGPRGPVFIDAECACFGDPAFDVAFCLAHMLLKCVLRRDCTDALDASYGALREGYFGGVCWEPPSDLESRAARLVAALLLARVDGKSPVEYVNTDTQKATIRRFAKQCLIAPNLSLGDIRAAWRTTIRTMDQ